MSRWPNEPLPEGVPFDDLPASDPHCTNKSCDAFAKGFNESENEIPLMSQIDYGWWMLCYYGSWVLIFVLAHLIRMAIYYIGRRRKKRPSDCPSLSHRLVATYRSLIYRRFTGRRLQRLELPSFGVLALLSLSTIFTTCLIFPEQPYLRSLFRYGSPPLSIRCAMIISALMPLLIALAGKVNIVTVFTGSSYARLNIYHRYVGGLIFALATVHMVPHFVAPIQDGGYDHLAQLFIDKKRELSGTILYFIFLLMILFSVPWFRSRFYEFFAYTHFFLAFCFLGLLWWHIHGEYMSPIYIYLSVGLWVASALLRMTHRNQAFRKGQPLGFPTTIEALPGKMTRVTVRVPQSVTWKPGQHAFMRIPGISLKDNHPFSIASIPAANDPLLPGPKKANELVFLVGERKGFTHKLAERARSDHTSITFSEKHKHGDMESQRPHTATSLRTLIDGPYGDHLGPIHRLYDSVVLVASGTGIASTLPWASHLAAQMALAHATGSHDCRVRDIRLVWIVRQAEQLAWIREELDAAVSMAAASSGSLVVDVYVTRGSDASASASASASAVTLPRPESKRSSSAASSTVEKEKKKALDALTTPSAPPDDSKSRTLSPPPRFPRPTHAKSASLSSFASTNSTLFPSRCPSPSPSSPSLALTTPQNTRVHFGGRPDLATLVPKLVRGGRGDAKNAFVLACGSAAVVDAAIGRGVAQAQKLVGKGEGKGMFGVRGVGEALGW
ncbi:ferric reductase NAD binding domain-containing protein [Phyllosticta capitalensis]|uniref:ferric-chelate reductase (NADPH) n=1 Tax=Phyllosticta capitalensis TaxID=121624 RepID=A0ABR1YWA9_9PEZI